MENAIVLGVVVIVSGIALGLLLRRLLRSWLESESVEPFRPGAARLRELSGEELAFLIGGRRRLLSVLVTRLRRAGHASFDTGRLRPASRTIPDDAAGIDLAVADALRRERNLDIGALRGATKEEVAAIHHRLAAEGLVLRGGMWIVNRVAGMAPLVLGAGYLFFRASDLPRGHDDLPALCTAAMIAIAGAIVMLFVGAPATASGLARVKELGEAHPPHEDAAARDRLGADELAVYAALHGERYFGPEVARFLAGAGQVKGDRLGHDHRLTDRMPR